MHRLHQKEDIGLHNPGRYANLTDGKGGKVVETVIQQDARHWVSED